MQYILDGIANGFRIGFKYDSSISSASTNHPSANDHPDVIKSSLQKEVSKGRLVGPLDPHQYPFIHISSLGAIPKKHSADKWRLILDLSHPEGRSINDGIDKHLCTLSYIKVDEVVQQILRLGKGCKLAKIDIESAFRNIPVHPHDRQLLGMQWDGCLYVDTVLPFGLRSAPKIFNCIADALQWVAKSYGVSFLEHLLDDFITAGPPNSTECDLNLQTLMLICCSLGLPLATEKQEGPTTCLTFLGIELDTESFTLRLPQDKLTRLKSMLQRWVKLKCCRKKDLQSLVGYLHDASVVIRPGRTFIRRLIDLLKSAHYRQSTAFLRLNTEARSDILWWLRFIEYWNGLSMMQSLRRANPDTILTSDASGSWGCGAFSSSSWFQYQWPQSYQSHHITVKELLPIVIAAAIWGHSWENQSVLCRCDNEAVVHIINTGTSKDHNVMQLMRCLHFIAAHFNLLITAKHLPGINNEIADALSRNNLPFFFAHYSQALPLPSPIPLALLNLLVHHRPDWTSPSWSEMFRTIFRQPFPKTPCDLTPQASKDI